MMDGDGWLWLWAIAFLATLLVVVLAFLVMGYLAVTCEIGPCYESPNQEGAEAP